MTIESTPALLLPLTILLGVCLALLLVAVGLYQRALAYWKERAEELELELEAERIGSASVMSRVGARSEVTVEQSAGATTFEKKSSSPAQTPDCCPENKTVTVTMLVCEAMVAAGMLNEKMCEKRQTLLDSARADAWAARKRNGLAVVKVLLESIRLEHPEIYEYHFGRVESTSPPAGPNREHSGGAH